MTTDYVLIECNDKNEFRTDASFKIFGLVFSDVSVKIDTGCSHTTIPVQKIGIDATEAYALKLLDSANANIKKHISFGINDSIQKREDDKRLFVDKKYMDINTITFERELEGFKMGGIQFGDIPVNLSYDRTSNILIGVDILKKLDIHLGMSNVLNREIMIFTLKENVSEEYQQVLNRHFLNREVI